MKSGNGARSRNTWCVALTMAACLVSVAGVADLWVEDAKLVASDGAENDQFGGAVAISGDTALVGAPNAAGSQGAVYVFSRTGEVWTEQTKLTAADGAGDDLLGTSIILENDTALIGAPGAAGSQGAVYVFSRSGEVWTEQAKLTAADGGAGDLFGTSITFENDTALVGTPGAAGSQGAAYVFSRAGDVWTEQTKLTAADGEELDLFGNSVALAGDTALIGAPWSNPVGNQFQGAVYVFARNGEVWTEQATLITSDGAEFDSFGWDIAVSGDTALIGAREANGLQGAAYVFIHGDGVWTEQAKLTVNDTTAFSLFGVSVALNGDRALVGVGWQLGVVLGDSRRGAAYSFIRHGESWNQRETLTASDGGLSDSFGLALALSGDDALVGSPGLDDNGNGNGPGAAYSFVFDEAPTLDVDPEDIAASLEEGQSETHPLTIADLGGETLEWEVTEEGEVPPSDGFVNCRTEPGIIIHDDGTMEGSVTGNPEDTALVAYADRFTPSAYPASFSAVCVSIHPFFGSNATSVDFEVVVFDDDGPDGTPGTELGALPVSASGILAPRNVQPPFFSYDISSLGLSIDSGSVFVGMRWAPSSIEENVGLAFDASPGNPPGFAGGYVWFDNVGSWASIVEAVNPEYRSLAVHAVGSVDCVLPTWASVDPSGGSVPTGESDVVDVTFDATGLAPGVYEANLCLSSNDPQRPLSIVPLHLAVSEIGLAELTFDPPGLDFGEVEVGTTSPPQAATLQNTGNVDVTGIVFGMSGSGFTADTDACGDTLPVSESCEIGVTFTPVEPGPAAATLVAFSAEKASASLSLTGAGVGDGPGFTPMGLEVDPVEFISDGNGVFEPAELVDVMPAWRNDGIVEMSLSGAASGFGGADGADYVLALDDADYGSIEPGSTTSCQDTGICYLMAVNDPVIRPAMHWEAAFDETLSDDTTHTWSLHIGDSFTDVPRSSPFYTSIETLLHHGVTGGCADAEYCPAGSNTRGQMAVFLLKAADGGDYAPPACVEGDELFADVPADSVLCPWIEELAGRQVTSGCGGGNYCPGSPVTRGQMAVFLLKTFEGGSYTPPECTGEFTDVTCLSTFAAWVEELFARGITGGCSADPPAYCPAAPVTRQQMAVFVTKTFGLTLYGP